MKYVMFELPVHVDSVRRVPVVFDEFLVHADMAKVVLMQASMNTAKIVSAGFYDPHTRITYDKSESLGLHSRPEDRSIILYPQLMAFGPPTAPQTKKFEGVAQPLTSKAVSKINKPAPKWV